MRPDQHSPLSDRRHDGGLTLSAKRDRLRIGRYSTLLVPGMTNRDVLEAYVQLAARSRHDRAANLTSVRHSDIAALAHALDVDSDDLNAAIELVLGQTRQAAQQLAAQLKGSRVIGGLSRAATSTGL